MEIQRPSIDIIRSSLEKIIFSKLDDNFYSPQTFNVENFLKQLTDDISSFIDKGLDDLNKKYEEQKAKERLRNQIIRFIETLFSKIVWDEQASDTVWSSFILISDLLQKIALNEVIDHMDDLDDLFWSITHSFCRYLNNFGMSVPVSCYKQMESDLENNKIYFLEVPEKEFGIRTKKDHLWASIFNAKVKSYAFENKGIISQAS